QPVGLLAGSHTSAGHAKKTGEQNDVGEELQEDDVGGEPTNACQLQKENQEADQEKIKTVGALADPFNLNRAIPVFHQLGFRLRHGDASLTGHPNGNLPGKKSGFADRLTGARSVKYKKTGGPGRPFSYRVNRQAGLVTFVTL